MLIILICIILAAQIIVFYLDSLPGYIIMALLSLGLILWVVFA